MMTEISSYKSLTIPLWTFQIISTIICFSSGTPILDLTPIDPYRLAGSTLNFTCTLDKKEASYKYNTSDIRWKIDGKDVPITANNTAVISSTEAILMLTNLTMTGYEQSIKCFLGKSEYRRKTNSESFLTVGIMPSSPTLHCRSTNIVDYWCEWSTEFTGVKVVHNFQFQDSSKTWIDCSNIKENTCRVFESDGNPMKQHLVRVTVTNMFGTATTTTTFDSRNEAIPLPPVISKLSVGESNVTVFWEYKEYCYYCNSLWFQLRYRRLNETWKETKQQQRKTQMTIEEVTTADKYEFQVRSRFSLAHPFSEWSSIASTFSTVSLIIHASTPTASEHVLSLQWEKVELGTHEYLYRITGNYIGKSLRESVNEELTVNSINLNVPCNVTENIIVYLELRRIIQVDALEIEGPPTSIHYDFQCIKEDLVTIKQPIIMTERHISTTVAVQYTGSRSDLIISFLVVGIIVAFALLFGGAFKVYFHKRIFIQWPEPKFFKVEISSFSPRSVEKEFFDDLKPRKSNFLKSYSSTSSDQGFHEFSPDSHVNEEPNTYVVVPSIGTDYQISVVNENGSNYLKNAVTTDNITLKEGSTPYFRLRKTDDYDTLQLSPLVAEESRTDEDSNPYTKMTSVFSDKSGKNAPETNYVSDPYCKLDEVLHANVEDINPQAVSTEYTPFTGDYYDRKEEFIGEEEIENLLNGMPETVNTYDMFTY